jgi:probable H4MPT-linked C1 transfer pathway protein
MGSTTTDVVPLRDGKSLARSCTDTERLHNGELIYTGCKRTPVCSLVTEEVAAELFATTHDVYLILGLVPEDKANCDTADGRPATRGYARGRLARMFGWDGDMINEKGILFLASRVEIAQKRKIEAAISKVEKSSGQSCQTTITSGSGEFLLRRWNLGNGRHVSLSERLGPEISEAACAHAVAMLAAERA